MTHSHTRATRTLIALGLAVVAAAVLSGCGGSSGRDTEQQPTPTALTRTAKQALPVAASTLETMAPDAKLLVVQTAEVVKPGSAPVWGYVFGSPSTDKTYVVWVQDGKAVQSRELGTAGLSAEDWASVPSVDVWKTDSDEAYDKALAASGRTAGRHSYTMGFQSYLPDNELAEGQGKVLTWYIAFGPEDSGETSETVLVDVKTGALGEE